MDSKRLIPVALLALAACATSRPPEFERVAWRVLPAVTDASLRGLAVVSADVVWASGTHGTVLRSVDGGRSFEVITVAPAKGADLRSIHAFDAEHALVATAGTPAYVLRTDDGGRTWRVVHADPDPAAFFDSLRFGDDGFGVLFGDPTTAGEAYVRLTHDGGLSFTRPARPPSVAVGEAGFAASGTCVAVRDAYVWIATGGTAARVLRSADRGATFDATAVPVRSGAPSQGVFSIAFADAGHGVAVGGDYLEPDVATGTAAFTTDGGRTWHAAHSTPRGYRSAVAAAPRFGVAAFVAVGPHGADVSLDGGRIWSPWRTVPTLELNAVALAPERAVGFAVGPKGTVARFAAD